MNNTKMIKYNVVVILRKTVVEIYIEFRRYERRMILFTSELGVKGKQSKGGKRVERQGKLAKPPCTPHKEE